MSVTELPRRALHSYWRWRNSLDIRAGRRAKHVVICGCPRSGTSLLFNMVSASIAGFRCEPFERQAIRRQHRPGNYVTKFPLDLLNVNEIQKQNVLAKDIYFIAMIRDVRDLITSQHPMVPGRYFIGYQTSLWPEDPKFSTWDHKAPGIEAVYKAIRACSARTDINFLAVRYENLVTDSASVQKQIEEFIGITFTESFSDYHTRRSRHAYTYTGRHAARDASLVRESSQADPSRVGKWRDPVHAGIIRSQFRLYPELFQILIEDGYETDASWFKEFSHHVDESGT